MVKGGAIVTTTNRTRLGEMLKGLQSAGDPLRRHIRELTEELQRAEVISPTKIAPAVITMNSRFGAWDLDSGRSESFTLVYHGDFKMSDGRLSVLSPMGLRALGSRLGDVIDVRDQRGVRRFRIERILYQPESAGGPTTSE